MNNVINPTSPVHTFRHKSCLFILFLSVLAIQACAKYTYNDVPINNTNISNEINSWSINDSGLNHFLITNGLAAESLMSNLFSIKRLYLTGLYYDPEMQVAYRKWKQAKIALDHNDYSINPKISSPLEHHSDNTDTSNLWSIGAVISFIYERKGKREARKAKAEVDLLNATLKIKQLALNRYGLFEERYHAYVIKQAEIIEIRNEISVLKELLAQLQNQYQLGAVSHFELNNTKLELQQGVFQLSIEENNVLKLTDELLAMTQLIYSDLENIEILSTSPRLFENTEYQASEYFTADFSDLQKIMLDSHIDMAIKLNHYALAEADLKLLIEKQYPDIVLSPGFIFDQSDNVWSLGSSWVLPLFEKTQQNLNILTALEERRIKQQEITVLQKELLNALYKSHHSISRHKEAIKISDEIVRSIEDRMEEIETQIDMGGVDQTALLRNRIELYKARQEQMHIYKEAINAILEFEHLLHSTHSNVNINDVITKWLEQIEERLNDELVN